jgi:hypothetical protein
MPFMRPKAVMPARLSRFQHSPAGFSPQACVFALSALTPRENCVCR